MAQMIFSSRGGEDNYLTRLNPLTKLMFMILFSFAVTSRVMAISLCAMAILMIVSASIRVPIASYLKRAPALPFLALFIFVTEWIVSKDASRALHEAAKFSFLILTGALLLDTTDPYDLSSSLGALLSPIFGHLAWKMSSYVMLTLALLPVIFNASGTMMDARRSRLGSFFSHPIRNISEYMLSLMLNLISSAETYSDALESRLYDENAKRLGPNVRLRDIVLITLTSGAIICLNLI